MKKEIHHKSFYYPIRCLSCEHQEMILSTRPKVTVEVCCKCHVFYTKGSYKDKKLGRIDRFYRKYKER